MNTATNALISLLPVLAFLSALIFLDSFKLVPLRTVLRGVAAGALAAAGCFLLNVWLQDTLTIGIDPFRRYIAPLTEETLKAIYILILIRTVRVGFVVDAAIVGFSIGAGFSLVENIYYLRELGDSSVFVWGVRGFGTALIHGSTTAVFAIMGKGFSDRHQSWGLLAFVPGFVIAFGIHSLYNHFILEPMLSTVLLLALLPFIVIIVFERSEKATRNWLGIGFDTDVELLEDIHSGRIQDTPVGHYLESLKEHFPGELVADMLCLLQVHLELSVRAKGILMAREAGLPAEAGERVRANLEEMKYLEKSIGRTGKLALTPILNISSRDLWQLYMLGK